MRQTIDTAVLQNYSRGQNRSQHLDPADDGGAKTRSSNASYSPDRRVLFVQIRKAELLGLFREARLYFLQNLFSKDLAANLAHHLASLIDFADQLDRGKVAHSIFTEG